MSRQEHMINEMQNVRKEISGSKFADKYDANEQAIIDAINSVPEPILNGACLQGRELAWLACGQYSITRVFDSGCQFRTHILALTKLDEKLV